jgi:hypothetical protein
MTTEQYEQMNGWSNMYLGKRRDNADVFRRYILSSSQALQPFICSYCSVVMEIIPPHQSLSKGLER